MKARESFLKELTKQGVKHTPGDVVTICRHAGGKIAFLEEGTATAGLRHIVRAHGDQFARRGISEAQIPDAVMTALTEGKVVGKVGTGANARPVYEFLFRGKTQGIAVGVSKNGFVVTAHPADF